MVILSKDCKRVLGSIAKKKDIYNIYDKNILKYIQSIKNKNISNLQVPRDESIRKIINQLPDGLYVKISEIENVIKDHINDIEVKHSTQSPLYLEFKELMPCKLMKHSKGNVITGRDKEIESLILSMCKKDKRGVILTGEAGTGKTSIVRAFATRLIEKTVPKELIGCTILNMDVPYIITKYKEDPVGTIVKILERASQYDKAILFIDEVHQLFSHKMNDIMKPYLTEKIRFIGSTTTDEFHSIISRDEALERRFGVVKVREPDYDETVNMIKNTKRVYEEYHRCVIPDDSIKYIVSMANRFMGHRKNPDKSLDILDTSCSEITCSPSNIKIPKSKYDNFDNIEDRIKDIKHRSIIFPKRILNEYYINKTLSNMTGITRSKLSGTLDYVDAKTFINDNVINQKKSSEILANTVNIIKHTKNNERPLSIFLQIGKSGVGKKYSAKVLSEYLFGSKGTFIEYNMSAFKDSFSLTEIKGSPPGYVGYGKSGGLIKKIRDNPQSILYFRNINNADPGIVAYIVEGCRSGKLVDSAERVAKLNSSIIIFSVTLSDHQFSEMEKGKSSFKMGFTGTDNKNEKEKSNKSLISNYVSQNISNICDEILIYNDLGEKDLKKIFDNNIDHYLSMYDVDINKTTLKKKIIPECKNAHDVISKISSEVPRTVFNKLRKKEK